MSEQSNVEQLLSNLEDSLAQAKAARVAACNPPEGWEHVGWIDEHGNLWALNLRNGVVISDRPVFAPPAAAINYTGPDASVECAYPPCRNRLRKIEGEVDGPQWCSKEHRLLTERAEFIAFLNRPSKDVCPSCGGDLMGPVCCMTYSAWRCLGCGAHLDSRVVMPKTVYLDEEEPSNS